MKTLNANEIYDKGTFSRYHFNLLFLLFVVIVFDGYDTAVYGAVVPILMEQWSLTPVAAGAIGSYTVIGTVVGALLFGLMADKVGPKKVTDHKCYYFQCIYRFGRVCKWTRNVYCLPRYCWPWTWWGYA